MVATKQKEPLWILYLVCQQEANALNRCLATIDVVTHEEVLALEGVVLARILDQVEEPQQVHVLPVDVAKDLDGHLQVEQDRLLLEDVRRLHDEELDLLASEQLLRDDLVVVDAFFLSDGFKLRDDGIKLSRLGVSVLPPTRRSQQGRVLAVRREVALLRAAVVDLCSCDVRRQVDGLTIIL